MRAGNTATRDERRRAFDSKVAIEKLSRPNVASDTIYQRVVDKLVDYETLRVLARGESTHLRER